MEKYKSIWKNILETDLLEDGDVDSQYKVLMEKSLAFRNDRDVKKKNNDELDLIKFMVHQQSLDNPATCYEKFNIASCKEYFGVDFLLYSKALK
jgi:hypothetical protein